MLNLPGRSAAGETAARPAVSYLFGVEAIVLVALMLTGLAAYFREPLTRDGFTLYASEAGQKFYT